MWTWRDEQNVRAVQRYSPGQIHQENPGIHWVILTYLGWIGARSTPKTSVFGNSSAMSMALFQGKLVLPQSNENRVPTNGLRQCPSQVLWACDHPCARATLSWGQHNSFPQKEIEPYGDEVLNARQKNKLDSYVRISQISSPKLTRTSSASAGSIYRGFMLFMRLPWISV